MTAKLHLIKLSVGSESIESLGEWQQMRMADARRLKMSYNLWHRTRMFPRRKDEILAGGGSIYWVIKGVVQCRQRITDIVSVACEDGIERTDIVLDASLVPVRPVPRRPFQGWRYLTSEDAPDDMSLLRDGVGKLPAAMRAELAELGLI